MGSEGKRKANLVIFCGAGFSKTAGLPLMGEFSDQLRASEYLTGEDQAEFDTIQLQCDALGAFIGGSARNLEQLASFLEMLQLTRPKFEFAGCKTHRTPEHALKLLGRGMRHLLCRSVDAGLVRQETRKLFDLMPLADLSFVTTNYDLLIEFSARSREVYTRTTDDVANGCDWGVKDRGSLYRTTSEHAIAVYKLHGSVNWLAGDDEKWVKGHCPYSEDLANAKQWPLDVEQDGVGGDWLMVPPSVLKAGHHPRLVKQWEAATEAIENADQLWFIGYSFPESDSFMRYFLASALFRNARIKQLAVIDPSMDACRRAKAMFRMPSLEQVVVLLPVWWEKVTYRQLLEGDWEGAMNWSYLEGTRYRTGIGRGIWGTGA